jgi:hypothetical protein
VAIVTMSQAFGARSGLQGTVSSEVGGANEANWSRGLLGNLGSWEELRRRRVEAKELKASTSSPSRRALGSWRTEQERGRGSSVAP